jgi:hypothetical protein
MTCGHRSQKHCSSWRKVLDMRRLLSLAVFLAATLGLVAQEQSTQARQHVTIEGAVEGLNSFSARFGPDFEFRLTARGGSWNVGVYLVGPGRRGNNLSAMTIPWSGPNAGSIIGWNFIPNANAPSYDRRVVFSPEVGDTITWDMVQSNDRKDANRLLERIYEFGHVDIVLSDVKLANVPVNTRSDAIYDVQITSFKFRADISWPAAYKGQQR